MTTHNAYFGRIHDAVWQGRSVTLDTNISRWIWAGQTQSESQSGKPYTFAHIRMGKCVIEMYDKHETGTGRIAIYDGDGPWKSTTTLDYDGLALTDAKPEFFQDSFEGLVADWQIGQGCWLTLALYATSSRYSRYTLKLILDCKTVATRYGTVSNEVLRDAITIAT